MALATTLDRSVAYRPADLTGSEKIPEVQQQCQEAYRQYLDAHNKLMIDKHNDRLIEQKKVAKEETKRLAYALIEAMKYLDEQAAHLALKTVFPTYIGPYPIPWRTFVDLILMDR